jgi:hypothetical protein
MFFDWFTNDRKNREKERMRILELKIRRLEQLQENPNSSYVTNPRGIHWHYHYIDSNGKIIEKR